MSVPLYQSGGSGGSSLATPVSLANGGTHADLSATGGANQIVKQSSVGGNLSVGALVTAEIPSLDASKITTGSLAAAQNTDVGSSGFGYFFGGLGLGSALINALAHAADGPSVANRVMLHQFVLTAKFTIRKMLWALGVVQAGKNVSMGIYDSSGNRVVDPGPLSINTGVAVSTMFSVTLGSPVTLNPGVYWYAWTADTTAVDIYLTPGSLATSASTGVNCNLNAVRYGHATNTSTAGQLPATLGVVISDTVNSSQPYLAVFEE